MGHREQATEGRQVAIKVANARILNDVNSLVGSFLPPAERPFGDYELIAKLATGGMAEIYLARQEMGEDTPPRLVVIKRVLPHLLEESRFIAMFRDEARLASQIVHPNVCRVFDSGRVQGTYFIAMEYLHGVPLSRMLLRAARTKQHLKVPLVVGLLIQCCNGLHHAHELKSRDGRSLEVVHRDVSPPNIFVTTEGLAKMLDFGVAKARGASQKTRTGTVKGKNSYMSPEQILGQEVDRRSDVFSLGIVLWEALASKRLFSRETDFLTFTAITKAEVEDIRDIRPEIGDELAGVVNKALAQDKDDRYSSAKELSLALWRANEDQEEYASELVIGEFVSQRFSKELLSKEQLAKDLSTTFDAKQDPNEPDTPVIVESLETLRKEEAQLGAIAPLQSETVPKEGEENPVYKTTDTQMLTISRSAERQRLVVAVLSAAAVTALLVALFLPSKDEPALVMDAAPELMGIAFDAKVALPIPVPPPVDAAPPDATLAVVRVDTRPSYLTVDSSPYATIYVDGKKLGVTPIFKAKLKPGVHKLKAVSATGATQRTRLNLKPGRTKNLGRLKW